MTVDQHVRLLLLWLCDAGGWDFRIRRSGFPRRFRTGGSFSKRNGRRVFGYWRNPLFVDWSRFLGGWKRIRFLWRSRRAKYFGAHHQFAALLLRRNIRFDKFDAALFHDDVGRRRANPTARHHFWNIGFERRRRTRRRHGSAALLDSVPHNSARRRQNFRWLRSGSHSRNPGRPLQPAGRQFVPI